jgi:hypothetical protein
MTVLVEHMDLLGVCSHMADSGFNELNGGTYRWSPDLDNDPGQGLLGGISRGLAGDATRKEQIG